MKSFLAAVVACVALAVAAAYLLEDRFGISTPEAFTTSGARIDSPGGNLSMF